MNRKFFSRIHFGIWKYINWTPDINAIYNWILFRFEKKKKRRKDKLRYCLLLFTFFLSFVLKIKRILLFDSLFDLTREKESFHSVSQ